MPERAEGDIKPIALANYALASFQINEVGICLAANSVREPITIVMMCMD